MLIVIIDSFLILNSVLDLQMSENVKSTNVFTH